MYIRASTASDANTENYQKLVIDGLTYQPSAYYFLRLTNTTTGEYYDVNSSGYNGGGSSPNYYTRAITFYVSPGTTNYYKAEARYLSSNNLTTVTNQLTSPEPTLVRPNNFYWTYSKYSGGYFNLTANEWNALTDQINQFRIYKELSEYAFYLAYFNDDVPAYMFNQAVYAISGMNPPTPPPSTVSPGSTIYAWQLNGLINSLNSIP